MNSDHSLIKIRWGTNIYKDQLHLLFASTDNGRHSMRVHSYNYVGLYTVGRWCGVRVCVVCVLCAECVCVCVLCVCVCFVCVWCVVCVCACVKINFKDVEQWHPRLQDYMTGRPLARTKLLTVISTRTCTAIPPHTTHGTTTQTHMHLHSHNSDNTHPFFCLQQWCEYCGLQLSAGTCFLACPGKEAAQLI